MGFLSQSGHLGLRTQVTKGVYLDPGAVAPNQGVFVRTKSGAMAGNRELLVPDPEIGGDRDIPDAQLGPINFVGDYDMYPRMESLAFFMKAVLGTSTPSGTLATGFTHTSTPGDVLPWISIEEKIANGYETFKYTDCKVNSFHLEADADGYLNASANVLGLGQAITTATLPAAQRVDTSPLLVGTNITVAWNAVSLPAKSFSLDITNNIEDDDFRLGSLFLGGAVEKRRELTLGVTIRPEDNILWRTAMWGAPGAVAPLGTSFKDDVLITITSYDDIPGATPGIKYSATFTVPKAIIAPFSLEPSGDDVLEHDIEIRAVRPDPLVPLITTAVKNSYATIN